jgi:hypothetical protein
MAFSGVSIENALEFFNSVFLNDAEQKNDELMEKDNSRETINS